MPETVLRSPGGPLAYCHLRGVRKKKKQLRGEGGDGGRIILWAADTAILDGACIRILFNQMFFCSV